MGVVYRAREVALNRHVAVKVLQPRFPADGAAAARFLEEAQITGQLQHPCIPPVHQVGTLADGRPFLVMKLIRGRTLENQLRERADSAADRGRFLAVFEQVCQAVACAHEYKVIHRDLKPANVMVGKFNEVQVMDWGLAKLLAAPIQKTEVIDDAPAASVIRTVRDSEGSFTQAGSVLGTPAFMPPEQAGGEIEKIDERSDVFGLGAILCVILTGKPPYTATDAEAVRLMAIRSQLEECLARLDGCEAEPELVAVCKRCLAADPADRPRDAGEVAKAVAMLRAAAEERARTAELEKVRAQGEVWAAEVRTAEQKKRRKVQAALGLTLTAAVALAGFGFWWNERREADAAADRAARRSRTAASVSAALDDARSRTAEAWALADEPVKMRTATDLTLAAVRRAEGFADAGDAPDETRAELAAVRAAAADLDRHARLFDAADRILQDHDIGATGRPAGEVMTARLGEAFREFGWDPVRTPAEPLAAEIAASRARNKVLGFLCDWEFQSGRDRIAQEKIRQVIRAARVRAGGALADWQRAKDAGDPNRLAGFAAGPEALTLGPELLCALGRDLRGAGQHDANLALLRRAADRYPGHVWLNFDLMIACHAATPPQRSEGLRAVAAAAALRPNNAILQQSLGFCYFNLREYDQATAHFRKAIALAPTWPTPYRNLATILTRGDPDGAVVAFREFVRRAPDVAGAHNSLGDALFKQKDLDGAVAAFRDATRLDPNFVIAHNNLGIALKATGDLDGAAAAFRQAVRLAPTNANYHAALGGVLRALKDFPGAVAAYRVAVRLNPESVAAHVNLAFPLAAGPDGMRDGKQAVEHATRACELTGWKDPSNLNLLAAAYAEAGDFDKAVEFNAKALAFPEFEKRFGGHARRQRELYRQGKPYRSPEFFSRTVAPPPREAK